MAGLIRVLLVDDHPLVRDGLAAILASQAGFAVPRTADTIEAATAAIERERPDAVLCDLFFGSDPEGFLLLERFGRRPDGPPIILLSNFEMGILYRAAIEKGAAGYLVKSVPVHEIVRAIQTVIAGRSALPLAALRAAMTAPQRPSAQEARIVSLVAAGRTNDEIAVALGICAKTVEGHLSTMFRRYDVVARAELAARAISEGWIARCS